jgi:hypothetical protein
MILWSAVGGALVAIAVDVLFGRFLPANALYVLMQGQIFLFAIFFAAYGTAHRDATILIFFVIPMPARWCIPFEILGAFLGFLGTHDLAGFLGLCAALGLTAFYLRSGGSVGGGRKRLREIRPRIERWWLQRKLDRNRKKRGFRVGGGSGTRKGTLGALIRAPDSARAGPGTKPHLSACHRAHGCRASNRSQPGQMRNSFCVRATRGDPAPRLSARSAIGVADQATVQQAEGIGPDAERLQNLPHLLLDFAGGDQQVIARQAPLGQLAVAGEDRPPLRDRQLHQLRIVDPRVVSPVEIERPQPPRKPPQHRISEQTGERLGVVADHGGSTGSPPL